MTQTVLPFKLDATNDTLTDHVGLALIGEYGESMELQSRINSLLPGAKSSVGYSPFDYIYPLILTLHGGGKTIADLRTLREDKVLQDLLKIETIPSDNVYGDWLVRHGNTNGLSRLGEVLSELSAVGLANDDITEYTLDLDATQVIAEKQAAKFTYKGEKGYMPRVGHIAENGPIIGDDFRAGNVAPATDNLGFIKYCE